MSIPEELVEAAATAMFDQCRGMRMPFRTQVGECDRTLARIAIASAFAELEWCAEATMQPATGEYQQGWADAIANLVDMGKRGNRIQGDGPPT